MKLARLAFWGLLFCTATMFCPAGAAPVLDPDYELSPDDPIFAGQYVLAGAAIGDSLPIQPIPFVDRISTEPAQPTDQSPTWLVLEGSFPYPCGVIFNDLVLDPTRVTLAMRPVDVCPAVVGWRTPFNLGVLPAGLHRVEIRLRVFGADSMASGDSTVYNGSYEFFVAPGPPPPPPGIGLPYVERIAIGPASNLGRIGPICPGDSIRVSVVGTFPTDCYVLKRIDLIPSIIASIEPPIVRLVVDRRSCLGRPCPEVLTRWTGSTVLPPLPSREYRLAVQLLEVDCTNEEPPDSIPTVRLPFTVQDCTPFQCLLGSFVRGDNSSRCDASVAPGRPAEVTYAIQTPVALAGLEGNFSIHPPGLRITRIEPVGPAAGMYLSWAETPEGGADFVLFAEHGAPIPPSTTGTTPAVPVLSITLARVAGSPTPPITQVIANSFGADAEGSAVLHCPTFAPVSANVCVVAECDHNGDGRLDVRDLVLMVRCLNGEGHCPDPAVLDCTHDGAFTLDDVICCAGHILRRNDCPDCPLDTTGVRHEPTMHYMIKAPVRVPGGVDMPIVIEGANRLGGARLALGFPSDRYAVEAVELKGNRPNWLDLHEVRPGEVVIGLIRLGPEVAADLSPLELTLALRLKPGQQPGGEVTTLESEFSGVDGVPLEIEVDRSAQPLARPLVLDLSPNRPEPFSGETFFTVALSEPSDVRVAIYDVGGRLVRMLHTGRMGAGTHEMRWDGTRGDGAAMRRGVYFYRVVAGDQTISRKMVLIGH